MAVDLEKLVVQLQGDVRRYEQAMAKAQGTTNRTARNIETRFARMNRVVNSNVGTFARGVAGGVVAGFSLQQAGQLIDASTRITNALKVAGLEGEALTKTYERLFQIAKANATPFEALVGVYSKAAQAGKDLGASQEDLFKFSETLAKSLRVSGKSAQEASGALLQLGQALGGGKIQAEEYNSLIDGAYPLLQAVAAGLKEAGGSVSALTRLVKDGKVSSEAFFRAALAGAPILEDKLAGAVQTISQRMENLRTSMINAATEFEGGTSAAGEFGNQLDRLAAFIDSVNFGKLILEIKEVAAEFGAVVETVQEFLDLLGRLSGGNLLSGVGRATGLDQIGEWLTGGQGRADFFEGGLTVTSQKVVRDRINQAFVGVGEAVTEAGELTSQAIVESARRMGSDVATTGKTGRLPAATGDTAIVPVSIEDYKVEGEKAGKAYMEGLKGAFLGGRSDVEGLNQEFAERLNQFIQDANRQGQKINIFSAHRSLEHQADLYWDKVDQLMKQGMDRVSAQQAARKWVAFPSPEAPHIKGIAADLKFGSDAAKKWAHDMAESYGLVFRMSHEGWHVELADQSKVADSRERQLDLVQRLQAQGETETARIQLETALVGASNAERERQIFIFERLNELQSEGVTITDALRAQVEAEAQARFGAVQAYDATTAAADRLAIAQENLQAIQDEVSSAFQGALKGLISDLVHGKDATEALYNAVSRLADRLLDIALDQIFASLFGGGLGGGGGLLAGIFHSGGKAGAAMASRTVHPALFMGAPRAHNGAAIGLKPGEVPIIAKQGEMILPKSKVSAMSKQGNAAPSVDARTTVINRFDAAGVLSEALSQPEGVKVVLNVIRSQPGAFRQAING